MKVWQLLVDSQTYPTGYFRSFFMKLTSSRFLMPYLGKERLGCYTPIFQEPPPWTPQSPLSRGGGTPAIAHAALTQHKGNSHLLACRTRGQH